MASSSCKGDQIALRSGMVKVTFDCGAEVVLEGPVRLSGCTARWSATWLRGKITANVPRRAFSFAILSPEVDFVDLGTSFGVNVGTERADRAARVRRRSAVQPAATKIRTSAAT